MEELFEDEFSAVSWLDTQLRLDPKPDQAISQLLVKLQLMEQEIEASLDYKTNILLKELPDLTAEMGLIYTEIKELSEQTAGTMTDLETLYSGDIHQLRHDLSQVGTITNLKEILRDIDEFDRKITQLDAKFDNADAFELAHETAGLCRSLQYMQKFPRHSEYSARVNGLIQRIRKRLFCVLEAEAGSYDISRLKSLLLAYESLGESSEFATQLIEIRVQRVEFDRNLDFYSLLSELDSVLRFESSNFLVLFEDPTSYLRDLYREIIAKCDWPTKFLELRAEEYISAWDRLLSLVSYVKETSNCILPFIPAIETISSSIVYLEKTAFEGIRYSEDFTQTATTPIKQSWERVSRLTFGVCTYEWSQALEKALLLMLTQYSIAFETWKTETPMIKDLKSKDPPTHFSYSKQHTAAAMRTYENLLFLHRKLTEEDREIRSEYLRLMTTWYFSKERAVQKEIQTHLLAANTETAKLNRKFSNSLREGVRIFPELLRRTESFLEQVKITCATVFLSPVAHSIAVYSRVQDWAEESPTGPSAYISSIGEHLLFLLEEIHSENNELYKQAYLTEFSREPELSIPHELSVQFWIGTLCSTLLSVFSSKLTQAQSTYSKQLAADLEYLLNITKTLAGAEMGDSAAYQLLSSFKQ